MHAHAGQGDVHRQRLGHGVRAQFEQPRCKGTHRSAQFAPQRLAQLAGGQPARRAGHAPLLLVAPALLHRLQRQAAQAVPGRHLQVERFVAGKRFLIIGQAQAEALFEQEARRVAEALQQLRRLDGQPGLIGFGEQAGEGLRLRLGWLGQALGGAEPGQRIAGTGRFAEITRRERLQRMRDEDLLADRPRPVGQHGGHVHRLQHLAEQHRGRQHGVVARVAADIGQVQRLARREQRLQQQVAVVEAPRPVATARMSADQVEARRRRAPREGAIVQAEQADHAERQAAHRHHGAEGHRTGEKAGGAAALLQRGAELLVHQFQLDGPGEVGGLGLIAQGGAGLGEQQQRLAGLALVEQRIDQHLQVIRPLGQRARPSQLIGQAAESLDEVHQPPEQLPARAFQRVQRPVLAKQGRAVAGQLRRCSEAQQQAVQPLAPGKG